MRHRKAGRKFKRSPEHRRMLLRNLATVPARARQDHHDPGQGQGTPAVHREAHHAACRGLRRQAKIDADRIPLAKFRRALAVMTKKDVASSCSTRSAPASRTAPAATPASSSSPRSARATPPDGRHRPARRARAGRRPRPARPSSRPRSERSRNPPQRAAEPHRSFSSFLILSVWLGALCGGPFPESCREPRPRLPLLQDRPRRDPLRPRAGNRPGRRLPRHQPRQQGPPPGRPPRPPRHPPRSAR